MKIMKMSKLNELERKYNHYFFEKWYEDRTKSSLEGFNKYWGKDFVVEFTKLFDKPEDVVGFFVNVRGNGSFEKGFKEFVEESHVWKEVAEEMSTKAEAIFEQEMTDCIYDHLAMNQEKYSITSSDITKNTVSSVLTRVARTVESVEEACKETLKEGGLYYELSEERKDQLLNDLIDYLCDYGNDIREAIDILLDLGVEKKELLALNFDKEDVDMVLDDKEFD